MSQQSDTKVSSQSRFLVSWLIVGVVLGVIVAVIALSSGETISFTALLALMITFPVGSVVYGGFGLFLDGIFRHNFKYNEIMYFPWQWHIYPISATLIIAIAMFGWIIKLDSKRSKR